MRLSIKTAPTPIPDPAREARDRLGDAIARVSSLKAELAKADDAVRNAKRSRFLATERIEALEKKKKAYDPAEAYLAAVDSGATFDVVEQTGAIDQEIARLQAEATAWSATARQTAKLTDQLREDVSLAERAVNDRVSDVMTIQAEPIVADVVSRAEKAQGALIDLRATLRFYHGNRLISDPALRQRVNALLLFRAFPTVGELETAADSYAGHPVTVALNAAREALRTDPNATAPEVK